MKIELHENKVYFNNGSIQKEIHPFWLRERVDGEQYLDKGTQQRLFDPTTLDSEISINTASINEKFLEINFNDGVKSKLNIDKLALEFSNEDTVIKSIPKIKWSSTLDKIKNFEYHDNFSDSKEMHDLLVSFYLPFARAWELLSGSLVAIYLFNNNVSKKSVLNDFLCALGFILILTSIHKYSPETPFPSFYTIILVAGTIILIIFTSTDSLFQRIFSNIILVRIGLVSFSAYLWHQPVFAFTRLNTSEELSFTLIAFGIFISFFRFCLYRLNLFCPGYIISLTPLTFGNFLTILILSLIL